MNCLVVLVAGLILSASPGNSLQCYSCGKPPGKCADEPVSCNPTSEVCFRGVWKTGGMTFHESGCSHIVACNIEQTVDGVSVSTHCCNTDLCNASDQVKLSLLLFPALVSVWFTICM
ncbi:CD59 glycoprotein-like [Leucoraja erinacea]|uniref:CD59 glycoprotein-like n=1 Tax=Leucoraja erinaceus TaxID=7782 RepID=UPI002455D29C|nr:CD59 glycoprotein-like [Leucoraja erinacea]